MELFLVLTKVEESPRLIGMTDNDRNSRTLIVCFVVAVLTLIPLRMVEVGEGARAAVLGEEVAAEEQTVLEAPYEEIERGEVSCVEQSGIDELLGRMSQATSEEEAAGLAEEMRLAEENRCN